MLAGLDDAIVAHMRMHGTHPWSCLKFRAIARSYLPIAIQTDPHRLTELRMKRLKQWGVYKYRRPDQCFVVLDPVDVNR